MTTEAIKQQAHKEFEERFPYGVCHYDALSQSPDTSVKSFIDSLIDKTVQMTEERIVESVKKYSSYFKRQVSEWGDSYTDTVKGITEEELLPLITNKSKINK